MVGAIIGGIIGCLIVELIRYLYAKWAKKHRKPKMEMLMTENGMLMRPVGTEEWTVCNPYLDIEG